MSLNLHLMKAYYKEYNVNETHWMVSVGTKREYFTVIVPFNCFEEPLRAKPERGLHSIWLAKEAPGAEKYYPDYHCYTGKQPGLGSGRPVDTRTLEMIVAGCCPPILTGDFIRQEGGEIAKRDPIEEARKLHKRGYFGGGD